MFTHLSLILTLGLATPMPGVHIAPSPQEALSLGREALQGGDATTALPLLRQAAKGLGITPEGAEATYLQATAHGLLGDRAQAQAVFGSLLGGPLGAHLPPRMKQIAKRKGAKPLSPRGVALKDLLAQSTAVTPGTAMANLMAFAGQEADMPGFEAAMAAAQLALETTAWPEAQSAALRAEAIAMALPQGTLTVTQTHTLDIVVERSAREHRRARWAYGAACVLGVVSVLGLAGRPWSALRTGDLPILAFIGINGAFVIALLAGLYYLGLDPADTRPLYAPTMVTLGACALYALTLGLALTLGWRHRPYGAYVAAALGALGSVTTFYLFAYLNDYLPAFGL